MKNIQHSFLSKNVYIISVSNISTFSKDMSNTQWYSTLINSFRDELSSIRIGFESKPMLNRPGRFPFIWNWLFFSQFWSINSIFQPVVLIHNLIDPINTTYGCPWLGFSKIIVNLKIYVQGTLEESSSHAQAYHFQISWDTWDVLYYYLMIISSINLTSNDDYY